jgi:hypothetical protein
MKAKSQLDEISPECAEKLTGAGINLADAMSAVDKTMFYDAQQLYVGNMPVSSFGYADGGTVSQYLANKNAEAFVSNDYSSVILGSGVFTNLAGSNTYVHEMLHVVTKQSDVDLATRLGYFLDSANFSKTPSTWISYQLDNKCAGVQ